jgi:hypothetical protein
MGRERRSAKRKERYDSIKVNKKKEQRKGIYSIAL